MVQPVLVDVRLKETHSIGELKMSFVFRGNMEVKETENSIQLEKPNLKIILNATGRATLFIKDNRKDTDDLSILFSGFDIGDLKSTPEMLKIIARSGHALLYIDIYKSVQSIIKKETQEAPVFGQEQEERKKELMDKWVNMLQSMQQQKGKGI